MKKLLLLSLLGGATLLQADPTVDKVLESAPRYDAPGPGYPKLVTSQMLRQEPAVKLDLNTQIQFGAGTQGGGQRNLLAAPYQVVPSR